MSDTQASAEKDDLDTGPRGVKDPDSPKAQEVEERTTQSNLVPVTTKEKVIDPREETRAQLARGLLLILAFVVAGLFVFIGFNSPNAEILTQAVLPAVIGLTGTALGFYFGAHGQSGTDGSGRTQR